ncbi:MAG TPA: hypothetical protein VJ723_08115, partial [Candidatus Angelobacter sp.]|nr:hypothetical protein [Candidatus Angelobacter sp.]
MPKAARRMVAILFICMTFTLMAMAPAASHHIVNSAVPSVKALGDDVTKTLSSGKTFDQVAISPDGKQLAWVEKDPGAGRTIYVSAAKPGAVARMIGSGNSDASLSWSPDSKSLAFLSDKAKKGQMQLYVMNAAGGLPRQVTKVKGFLSTPGWSPDGKTIAALLTENATRAAGPLVAETAQTGV